jgi:hypothetical protein
MDTKQDIELIATEYEARFGDLDEIAHPAIMFDPKFQELMQRALADGKALTREDVDAAFPDLAWDW